MRDASIIFPVKDTEAGATIAKVLKKAEELATQYAAEGKYPVTYATYVRYFKGTNGGFSTSQTQVMMIASSHLK